ncbi:hypothetical protein ACHQM5_008414 [Ranunculus cassubicifolius]
MEVESVAARVGIVSAIGCAIGAAVGSVHGAAQAYAYKNREIFKKPEMKMRHIVRKSIYSSVAWDHHTRPQ